MKTSELTGAALDWAVAKCEGRNPLWCGTTTRVVWANDINGDEQEELEYSANWSQGGPIIDAHDIDVLRDGGEFGARLGRPKPDVKNGGISWFVQRGPTKLIAAMRCYVASKLGDEVDVPKELT